MRPAERGIAERTGAGEPVGSACTSCAVFLPTPKQRAPAKRWQKLDSRSVHHRHRGRKQSGLDGLREPVPVKHVPVLTSTVATRFVRWAHVRAGYLFVPWCH